MLKPLAVALALVGLHSIPARAQVARLTVVQRQAQKKPAGATAWSAAQAGTWLGTGDSFRTGKRSRADVNFVDGSLLRLGQLCVVEFTGAHNVRMATGQLLFSRLTPGRIVAGAAAAEIKGSIGIITLMDDGAAEFSLFSGAMNVVSPLGTVPLAPGHWVTAYADGRFSAVKVAPPLNFAFGNPNPELMERPADVPFAGSQEQVRQRSHPERLTLDQYNRESVPRKRLPFDPLPGVNVNRLLRTAREADTASSPSAALDHLSSFDPSLGRFTGADVLLVDILGEGGRGAYGGRLHGFAASGRWFLDGAVLPLRMRAVTGAGHASVDLSAVTSLEAIYRDRRGDIEVGRQRFLQGPSQVTAFGSLVRAGGREIMDALRVRPRLKGSANLEVAYLKDAFVRNLPYRVPGNQTGWYGRYGTQTSKINAGFNLLNYRNLPGAVGTGWSFDAAVPLVRHELELYGEAGRDPFRRRLTSAGLAFPGLARRTDVDLFLEFARLGNGAVAQGEASQLTLRGYRHLNRQVYMVADVSRFGPGHAVATVGLAVGERSYEGH